MNSVEQATALINRIKNLKEFEVVRTLPENFRFNGCVPFNMNIYGDQMYIKVYAYDLHGAMKTVDDWLGGRDVV